MAKILLVAYDSDMYIHWFPQGLAYIASSLLKAGHDVKIYQQDINHYPDEHLTKYLDYNKFDIVGVGLCGGYFQYQKLIKISEAINASIRRPFFMIGGHLVSPEPEYFLRKTQSDIVVIGEGEETVVELASSIDKGSFGLNPSLSYIKGIAYRIGEFTYVNERRQLIKNIDSIPMPAYHLFDINSYRLLRMPHCTSTDFVMPMLSGRGCTFKCNFCYRMDSGFRTRSPESIIKEIKFLQQTYNITYIAFSDELLMSSIKRTINLCNAFIEEGLNIKFDCNGRLNYATPDVLNLMKKAGCVFINYGIESLDDEVLKNMHKNLTVKHVITGIENTLRAGISPGLNIIFGNIGDTKETLQKGVDFLLKYDDGSQLRTIRPVTAYPGCELYYHAIKKGLLKDVEDFYENKHVNSDLLSINFTDMSDEKFHEELFKANSILIDNYFRNKCKHTKKEAEELYINQNRDFRGFRQT
jgi:radical SAM superfamily enzyme YgiQ (UPF0313 family)